MKQVIRLKRWRADIRLVASAIIAGLIVGTSLEAELVSPASALGKIEARIR